ncbi:MAG: hypothetical protein JWN14_4359 [Chthonomonadales bacterium]|nr:hypothetical protein [Chthonomonadales bacterium]
MNQQSLTCQLKQQIIAHIESGHSLAHIGEVCQVSWRLLQKLDDEFERYGYRALLEKGEEYHGY